MRDPISRAVSAFFYCPPHTNVKPGKPHSWEKFAEHVQNPKMRNILTKMLCGTYAYAEFNELKHIVARAKSRLCSVAWFGLSEMPITSSMMLYETSEFQQLLPNPVAFGVSNEKNGLRVNNSTEYKKFLATFLEENGTALVMEHNEQDIEVYKFANELFCARLFSFEGLVDDMKQNSLGTEEIEQCSDAGHGKNSDVEQLCQKPLH